MKKKPKRPWAVFAAILLAMLFGSAVGRTGGIFGVTFYGIVDVLGTVFLNALTLVVVPLVSSSIISGISRIGSDDAFGRLGGKMFAFYLGTSIMAILIGLFFVNLIHPGSYYVGGPIEPSANLSHLQEQLSKNSGDTLINLLLQVIPSNIFNAFSHGQMLGLIFFCLLFGYSLSKIDGHSAQVLHGFFQGVFQTMIQVTHLILKFLPLGVFCLVSKIFMTTGMGSLQSVAIFSFTSLLGLATFMFIALPLLLKYIGKVEPLRHFKAMTPALVTAFSTSSSSATLPVTIDCVEKRAGVSNKICSLVVPLGNSINMSGSALYECVAAIFVAQAYGLKLTFATQFLVVVMSLITSMGVAGIPSGSLVAIIVILRSIGLSSEGIGLFIAVDRLLDMCRTTVNVFSDSCCAVLVARSEGETEVLTKEINE